MATNPESGNDRRPIVVSGPSGVGKGTLIQRLIHNYPDTFATTVSHTTRRPRDGEVEGKHHFFVSETQFLALISQNGFIQHAIFCGNYYGTSKRTLAEQTAKGAVVLLDIDIQGVKTIKEETDVDARFVFLKPPSIEALETRLRGRGANSDEEIQSRLAQAKGELDFVANHPDFQDKVITNDNLDVAFQELVQFVFHPTSSS